MRSPTATTPVAFHAFDGAVGRFATDDLTESELAVDEQHGAVVANDLGVRVRGEVTDADVAHVRGNHADAVRVVTLQIRFDEVLRHFVGDALSRTRAREDRGDEMPKRCGFHQHVVRSSMAVP